MSESDVWTVDDTDFVLLSNIHSLSDSTGPPGSDADLSSALDILSLGSLSASAESGGSRGPSENQTRTHDFERVGALGNTARRDQSSSDISASPQYHSVTGTPTASYDDASAFISRFLSSPEKGKNADLDLLRALIVELGLRSPTTSDLPSTLTSARKVLKAEAHINIKEYVATRRKGQLALREILKPSKNALRKDIRKGNVASLEWVKQQGLQVLLVTCFT